MDRNGSYIAGFVCGSLFVTFIALMVAAVFLRGAVGIYNMLFTRADPSRRIPDPNFGRALLIVFICFLIYVSIHLALSLAISETPRFLIKPGQRRTAEMAASALASIIGYFVMSAVFAAMLPARYLRALLVAVFFAVILFALVMVVGSAIVVFQIVLR